MATPSFRLNTNLKDWIHFGVATIVTILIIVALSFVAEAAGFLPHTDMRETITWSIIFALSGNLVHVYWRRR